MTRQLETTPPNRLHAELSADFFAAIERPVLCLCAAGMRYAAASPGERERLNLGGEVRMHAGGLDYAAQDWSGLLSLGDVFARLGDVQQRAVVAAQIYCDRLRALTGVPEEEVCAGAVKANDALMAGVLEIFRGPAA